MCPAIARGGDDTKEDLLEERSAMASFVVEIRRRCRSEALVQDVVEQTAPWIVELFALPLWCCRGESLSPCARRYETRPV